ncbi:hypothetical protein AB0H71_31505 [Nocardia sp. NPDC050697]|uniref:hypothetical protein n=1 Tax=Nocardia sp. NPDC050697 TaxID=3155158 RepID=UPI003402A514
MSARDRLDPERLAAMSKAERVAALRDVIDRVPAAARTPVLAVPPALGPIFPGGGLAKGSTVTYAGTSAVLLGLLAAVTADGAWAALVGGGRRGLLAFHEMGGALERLAVIRDPGRDPLGVVAALTDGIDLVVLDHRVDIPPARARTLAGRVRSQGAVLVIAGQDWPHPDLRIRSHLAGAHGLGAGRGRLKGLEVEVAAQDRTGRVREITAVLDGVGGRTGWTAAEEPRGAAAQPPVTDQRTG